MSFLADGEHCRGEAGSEQKAAVLPPQGIPAGVGRVKPKILHINKLYHPHIGGVETVVQNLCEQMVDRSQVEVLVCGSQGRMSREVINGISVTRAGSMGNWLSMPISLSYPFVFRGMAPRFDLIHFHHPFPLGELSALAFDPGLKMVLTWYSAIVRQKFLSRLYRPFLSRLLDRVDAIILIYPDADRGTPLLERHHDKCHVIPIGIEARNYDLTEDVRKEVDRVRQQYGDNLVLFVGRLVYYKGLQHLIAAMPSIEGKLLVAGDGPLRQSLRGQAACLGVGDRVRFLGRLSDRQLKVAFHACDVFVLPSTHPSEAFGIVQLEAMVCGKPVVNTRLPTGVPYVSLERVTGLTVEPGNPEALARAVNTLLHDGELRRIYGENGRQRVLQEFAVQLMADRTWRLYEKLLHQ